MENILHKTVMRIFNGDLKLDNTTLSKIFIKQLDNIYCIKKHLLSILPQLAQKASFPDLKDAILNSADEIKVQLLRMDVIYKMCNAVYTDPHNASVKALSLEAYLANNDLEESPVEADLDLLIHLQIAESVEMAYFSVLKNIAANMHNKAAEVLLDQNFYAATNSKNLFDLIAREYTS